MFYTSAQRLSSHPDCECLGTSVVPVCLLMRGVILPSQDKMELKNTYSVSDILRATKLNFAPLTKTMSKLEFERNW